jgi:hypothetical protein
VFIVTPHLAQPLPPDHKLPTDDYVQPSRVDFFLNGKMEGRPAAPRAHRARPAQPPAPPATTRRRHANTHHPAGRLAAPPAAPRRRWTANSATAAAGARPADAQSRRRPHAAPGQRPRCAGGAAAYQNYQQSFITRDDQGNGFTIGVGSKR